MVPTEIVDHILGFLLIEGDYSTLRTCSVIFPQPAERHLYSHITFTESNNDSDSNYAIVPTKFSLKLIDRPHIANYVRSLCIFVRPQDSLLHFLSAISPILSKLSHIKSIALSSTQRYFCPPTWDDLDSEFRMAFQNCIRSTSIEQVQVLGFDHFPLDIFDDCRNLRHLRLHSRYIRVTGSTVSIPHLRSLDITGSLHDPIIKTNSLHSLSLRMYFLTHVIQSRNWIEACSPTLVNIELNSIFSVDPSQPTTYSTFPVLRVQLPLLERITIRSSIIPVNFGDFLSALPIFTPFLFSLPITHPIRLCVYLMFSDFIPPNLDWSVLADLFVFPVFSQIELYVAVKYASLPDIVFPFKQNSVLMKLHGTGKLVIEQFHPE